MRRGFWLKTLALVAGSWLPMGARADESTAAAPATPATEQTSGRTFSWLGPGREIAQSWSASRDTPAMGFGILPRPIMTAGGDFALATFARPSWTLRGGFAGSIELEIDGRTNRFHSGPAPGSSKGQILWRGAYAYSVAVAPHVLAQELCRSCGIEGTLRYRHESQHYTGSNSGGDGEDVSHQPYVGDNVLLDLAVSQRAGDWYLAQRVIGLWFLPESSGYSRGVGGDLHVRWLRRKEAQPFLSLYGEWLKGDDLYGRVLPNAYRLRGLLGVALPSDLGDIMVFASGDVGHRYGVRILTEEATLGLGVRLAVAPGAAGRRRP